ncbi:hypothetical protein R3P38DRAFT_551162 [Favolaschia claudopus]|uniref:Secreted protein n=1 Tax=Favolaschia claudopus TaxID=2862362 RepID=A0AAV9ZBF5_9AGAR
MPGMPPHAAFAILCIHLRHLFSTVDGVTRCNIKIPPQIARNILYTSALVFGNSNVLSPSPPFTRFSAVDFPFTSSSTPVSKT